MKRQGDTMTNKLYMENPYLREIDAKIIEKKYRDRKYYIKLDRTIFYPHLSGGQPGDKGTINGIEILESLEDNGDIIHVVEENITSQDVHISIDWENRFDLMQQHSGQHLLSYSFNKLFNGQTVGFYIGKEYVYIDIDIENISDAEIGQVEFLANKIIQSNFQIKSYFVDHSELSKLNLRKEPVVHSNIRIVEMDSLDYSPCGGTHLYNTGELGLIKIRKWEHNRGNTRVEFVCGNRAFNDYSWKNDYIKKIGLLLSSKDKDILNNVNKIYDLKDELEKENRNLRGELYEYKANRYLSESKSINGINYIMIEPENIDLKDISYISTYLNNNNTNLVQIYGLYNDTLGQFFVSRSRDLDIDLQRILKEISEEYEIKGGGSSSTVQGGTSSDQLKDVVQSFYNKIKANEI